MRESKLGAVALAGVTVLAVGGTANAATVTETRTFNLDEGSKPLAFATFNTALGTLTGVSLDLDSYVTVEAGNEGHAISIDGTQVSSFTTGTDANYNFSGLDLVASGISLSFFEGDGVSKWAATLSNIVENGGVWYGSADQKGMTVTFTYDDTAAIPLPASLPLFLGGLALMGAITRKKRRGKLAN